MGMHESSIKWEHISRDDFDRIVETLLVRMYHRPPVTTAVVLDGRGGDGGIDVGVYDQDGKIRHIFQLKHFPQGFSGGFRDVRQRQIKESFDRAWTKHQPPSWTLVVPCKPTDREGKYVSGLAKGKMVAISTWGCRHLDNELAKPENRDILDVAARSPLLNALKTIGQENAALAGPNDLAKRAADLHGVASGRSLYWDTDFQVSEEGVTQILRAKHPRAQELEPLGFQLTVNKNAFGFANVQRLVDYGTRRRVTIPGAAVAGFQSLGPTRFQHEGEIDRIEIGPAEVLPVDQRPVVTLEFLDDDGFTRASHQGQMYAKSEGEAGIAFLARFYGLLEIDVEIPYDPAKPGNFDLSMEFANARVSDAQGTLRLLRDFDSDAAVQVLFDEKKFLKGLAKGEAQVVEEAAELLIDDLAVLQQRLNATFRVPAELSNRDRVMLRVARLLSEGKATWMPPETSLTGTLSGESDKGIDTLLSGACAISMTIPAFPIEVQGSRFSLGPALLYHPHTAVRGAEELRRAFQEGTAAGRKVVFAPQTEKLIWVMPGGHDGGRVVPPETAAWDLPGIAMPIQEGQEPPGGPASLEGR